MRIWRVSYLRWTRHTTRRFWTFFLDFFFERLNGTDDFTWKTVPFYSLQKSLQVILQNITNFLFICWLYRHFFNCLCYNDSHGYHSRYFITNLDRFPDNYTLKSLHGLFLSFQKSLNFFIINYILFSLCYGLF